MQAGFLRVKLQQLDKWNANRVETANKYLAGIKNPEVILPTVMDDAIDVPYKVLDEAGNVVEEFVPGVNGLDDTGRVLANSGDEILEAGSKILGSSDDIARAGSAGLKGLSKAGGKALGIAGIILFLLKNQELTSKIV